MEKIGRLLLFTQSTLLRDAGVSINIDMEGYMSELSHITNFVSSHGLSAESNQAVNNLALISARATMTAVEKVSMMSSAFLYALCQALDLRIIYVQFLAKLKPEIQKLTSASFGKLFNALEYCFTGCFSLVRYCACTY